MEMEENLNRDGYIRAVGREVLEGVPEGPQFQLESQESIVKCVSWALACGTVVSNEIPLFHGFPRCRLRRIQASLAVA